MTKIYYSRRDFLKLISLIPASITVKPLSKLEPTIRTEQPNIIVIVYDAWSARNTSLYGYPRATMPNLEKFAQKAMVYHRHYAAGNFTVPGTASLLTGVYPWKHRAFALGSKIVPKYEKKQIFNLLANNYQTVGYSQNMWADLLLYQTGIDLHTHIPNNAFNIDKHLLYSFPFFSNDPYLVFSSLDKLIASNGSLLLGPIISEIESRVKSANQLKYINQYHKNLIPESEEQFLLSNVVDGAIQILKNLDKPSIVYIHLYPPHEPFRPKNEFVNIFSDTPETLIYKPYHSSSSKVSEFNKLKSLNLKYDEYLASLDDEVSRLYQFIDQSGLQKNSYIFLTADHGEIFERGEKYHMTPLLNQPLVHIPLIVSTPEISKRQDIYKTTSAVDIAATIAHLAGISKPDWMDGELLPGFGGQPGSDRSVFSLEAKMNASAPKLTNFSLALTKNNKRLLFYQYKNKRTLEFYDLDLDPEEMKNLQPSKSTEGRLMKNELFQLVNEIGNPLIKV